MKKLILSAMVVAGLGFTAERAEAQPQSITVNGQTYTIMPKRRVPSMSGPGYIKIVDHRGRTVAVARAHNKKASTSGPGYTVNTCRGACGRTRSK